MVIESLSTASSESISLAAALKLLGPETTTRHGIGIRDTAADTSSSVSRVRKTCAFGKLFSSSHSVAWSAPSAKRGLGRGGPLPVRSSVQRRRPTVAPWSMGGAASASSSESSLSESSSNSPASFFACLASCCSSCLALSLVFLSSKSHASRHHCVSCGTISTSSSLQESTSSMGTASWSLLGMEMPSFRAGSRACRIWGNATTPVPASNSSTLAGVNVPSPGTRLGRLSVFTGWESHTRAPVCGVLVGDWVSVWCSHDVAAPSGYTLTSKSHFPLSHSFALLMGV
mmetsp:Transcript_33198/g.70928  ORF Transcript_33198/g.70928 Transcript_33198/m.70928 type:complete len:286 (+) Transcript_33198:405-1262(+)